MHYETITTQRDGAVLHASTKSPPLNMLGPELVRDMVSVILATEADKSIRVIVFKSGDPDYFASHVDVTKIKA